MRLGTKIALGFSSLIVIAVILGGVAIWRMWDAESRAEMLAEEYVPEVEVANRVERNSLMTMYEMRGYGLSEEEQYLNRGREHLAAVDGSLAEAEALADRAINLVKLKTEVGEVKSKVEEYKKLVEETVARNKALNEDREKLNEAATEYMENCAQFLEHQTELLQEELAGQAGHGRQEEVVVPVRVTAVNPVPCQAGLEVIEQLKQGNARYVQGQPANINKDQDRRTLTSEKGQHPQSTVLACSDSRVPVEILFDQGIGDVFPIRVAGNVSSVDELASIEYGVDHLATPLLVVLGHTHCGAVTAAATHAEVHGSIPALLSNIDPAVEAVKSAHPGLHGDDLIAACITENVWRTIASILTQSKAVQERAKDGKVLVVGAIYNISDGTVQWLGPHPQQNVLLGTPVHEPGHDGGHGGTKVAKDTTEQLERLQKITLVNDIIDIGNATRIACYKSQAMRDPEIIRKANENFDLMNKKFAALRKITRMQEDIEKIDHTQEAADKYKVAMNDLLDNWLALQDISKRRGEAADVVLAGAQATAKAGLEHTNQIADNTRESLSLASLVMIIGLAIAAVVGFVLAVTITRGITKPINRIIEGLNNGADQVNEAAAQVSSASQQLAEGASEQASSLEETSSALEEMAAMARTNAGNAGEANTRMEEARTVISQADKAMNEASDAMNQISEASDQISKIIKVIEEIAFQTNLLALNAAVEAARAGEHGKGFAVVADEVRNLAQRAASAAQETGDLIEQTVQRVGHGVEMNKTTSQGFTKISQSVEQVGHLIQQIAQASNEQAQGVEQVNTAVSQMDKVTQANASGAEESASASEELAAQAGAVQGMVNELIALVGGAKAQAAKHATTVNAPASVKKKKVTVSAKTRIPSKPPVGGDFDLEGLSNDF